MLLQGCEPPRSKFKDVDFLVPTKRRTDVVELLEQRDFSVGRNKNYENGDAIIGLATPESHNGLPDVSTQSCWIDIAGVRVLSLDELIESKKLAVTNKMEQIGKKNAFRSHRARSAKKQLEDYCDLCHARDLQVKRIANAG